MESGAVQVARGGLGGHVRGHEQSAYRLVVLLDVCLASREWVMFVLVGCMFICMPCDVCSVLVLIHATCCRFICMAPPSWPSDSSMHIPQYQPQPLSVSPFLLSIPSRRGRRSTLPQGSAVALCKDQQRGAFPTDAAAPFARGWRRRARHGARFSRGELWRRQPVRGCCFLCDASGAGLRLEV